MVSGHPSTVTVSFTPIPSSVQWLKTPLERAPLLVNVQADLNRVPNQKIPKKLGKDGLWYYEIEFSLEITHMSAYTNYELIYDNVNYGPVTAEYV